MPAVLNTSGTSGEAEFDPVRDWSILALEKKKQTIVLHAANDLRVSRITTESSQPIATTGLTEFIAFELSQVPEVEYVFTALRNGVFFAWIVIGQFEAAVRRRIYERQKTIIEGFPTFEFDFYIIARPEGDVRDLINDDVELTFERDKVG